MTYSGGWPVLGWLARGIRFRGAGFCHFDWQFRAGDLGENAGCGDGFSHNSVRSTLHVATRPPQASQPKSTKFAAMSSRMVFIGFPGDVF